MASSETVIVNMALAHLGTGKAIASMMEGSQEAQVASVFYDEARKETLRRFCWSFASKTVTLSLIETAPNDEWAYSYQVPADCLLFRRILSGIRNDTETSTIRYRMAYGDSGTIVYTDQALAQAEYTVNVDETQRFPSDFALALSYYLAHLIAPRLTAGDPYKLGDRAYQLYQVQITRAAANSANEERPDAENESSLIRARES